MTWLSFAVPLMIASTAIAVVPVLLGSFRHNKEPDTRFRSAAQEADFWHHMLGHRLVEDFAPNDPIGEPLLVAEDGTHRTEPMAWALSQWA